MVITLSISDASAIPEDIQAAIKKMGSEVPGAWWVSVIPDQNNDSWQLKLHSVDVKPDTCNIDPDEQNADGVQRQLRALLVRNMKIDQAILIDGWIKNLNHPDLAVNDRRMRLNKEIEIFRGVLADFGSKVPHDAAGEAHTSAYLTALEQARDNLNK